MTRGVRGWSCRQPATVTLVLLPGRLLAATILTAWWRNLGERHSAERHRQRRHERRDQQPNAQAH